MMTNSEQYPSTTSDPVYSENESTWRSSWTIKPQKKINQGVLDVTYYGICLCIKDFLNYG